MATVSQPSYYNLQALTDLGALGVGMRLYTYSTGTTTHKNAYTEATGTTVQTYTSDGVGGQYIALNARGELPSPLYLTTGSYDLALKTSAGATVWTRRADSLADTQAAYTPPQSGATATTLQAIAAINFNPGNATAVAGSAMKISALMEAGTPTFPLKDEAGIWPGGPVYSFAGISKEFTSSDGGAGAPSAALFSYAVNNNSAGDICAGIFVAVANTNNDAVYGVNVIARNSTGTTGTKLVGMEIDVEPAAGTTVATTGGGLFINAFSIAMGVPAIQLGGVSSGTFNNGLVLGGLATNAAGVSPSSASTMDSMLNTGAGVFTTAAAIFSNTHKIRFSGTAAAHAFIYNDGANALRIVGGSVATVIRNNADTVSNVSISDAGIVSLSSTGTINFDAAQTGTSVGAAGGASALPATPLGYFSFQRAGATVRVPYYN